MNKDRDSIGDKFIIDWKRKTVAIVQPYLRILLA
jgi:hypothetical protein